MLRRTKGPHVGAVAPIVCSVAAGAAMSADPDTLASSNSGSESLETFVMTVPDHPPLPECFKRTFSSMINSVIYKCDSENSYAPSDVRIQEIQEALFKLWSNECLDVTVKARKQPCGKPISTCADDHSTRGAYLAALSADCGDLGGNDDKDGYIVWKTCNTADTLKCRRLSLPFSGAWRSQIEDQVMYFGRKVEPTCQLCSCDFESRRVDCQQGIKAVQAALAEPCEARDFGKEHCKELLSANEAVGLLDDNGRIRYCFNEKEKDCEILQVTKRSATWLKKLSPHYVPPTTTIRPTTTTTTTTIRPVRPITTKTATPRPPGPSGPTFVTTKPSKDLELPECFKSSHDSVVESMIYKCDPDTNLPVVNSLRLQEIQKQLFELRGGECLDLQVRDHTRKGVVCGEPISTCASESNIVTYPAALSSECGRTHDGYVQWKTCDLLDPNRCGVLSLSTEDAWRTPIEDQVMYFGRKVEPICQLCSCDFQSRRVDCEQGITAVQAALAESCEARDFGKEHCKELLSLGEAVGLLDGDARIRYCFNENDCETVQVAERSATLMTDGAGSTVAEGTGASGGMIAGLAAGGVALLVAAAAAVGCRVFWQHKLRAANQVMAMQRNAVDENSFEQIAPTKDDDDTREPCLGDSYV